MVVVGSGFGGAVTALRLTEAGHRVLVLEKGRRLGDEDLLVGMSYVDRPLLRRVGLPFLLRRG